MSDSEESTEEIRAAFRKWSENDVQHFLMDHNFIFGALATNVAIYVDYRLTNKMSVDCIVIEVM